MDVNSYNIAYNGQTQMYFIRPTEGSDVPETLSGFFTHKHYAEKQIHIYVEELKSGDQKREQAVQPVRKRTNNRG